MQCLLLFYTIDIEDHQWISLPVDKTILRREVENMCTVYSSLNSFLLWQLFSLQFYCAFWQRKYNTCIVVQSQPHSPMYFLILFVYLHQQLLLSTKSSAPSSREIKLWQTPLIRGQISPSKKNYLYETDFVPPR